MDHLTNTAQITDAHFAEFAKTLSWCNKATIKKYEYSVRMLRALSAPFDIHILCAYDRAASARCLNTRETEIAGVKRFLWHAQLIDLIPTLSVEHARDMLRIQRGAQRFVYKPRVPDMEAVRAVVAYWANLPLSCKIKFSRSTEFRILRNRALFLTMISTGARVSEVISLKVSQVALREERAWICGKRGLWRYIYFTPESRQSISEYLHVRKKNFGNAPDALWLSEYQGRPMDINGVAYQLEVTLVKLGLPKNLITCHSFRHFVATEMLSLGFPIHYVQKYLGHTSINTTMTVYAHVLDADMRRAVSDYHTKNTHFTRRPPPPQSIPVLSAPPTPPPMPVSYVYLPAAWEMSVSERV